MQVVVTPGKKGKVTTEEMSLVEVGPRVCLQPIKIFAGSFGGPVLYENPGYVSPNKVCDASGTPLVLQHFCSSSMQSSGFFCLAKKGDTPCFVCLHTH